MAMWDQEIQVARGLAGVVAGTTKITMIDGEQGRLYHRGYDINDLARYATYEEVAYLLLYGELPTASQLRLFNEQLVECRSLSPALVNLLRNLPGAPEPMDALRAVTATMAATDHSPADRSRPANLKRCIRLIAQMPTVVAAHWRMRQGEDPIPPDPSLGLAANFVYMLFGKRENHALVSRFLNMCMVLMADHGFNASTFAARVTASTLADVYAAFTAGIAALNGPLHGAANAEAMKMLLEIGSLSRVESWIRGQLAIGKRIMGFGHRTYKTVDPRAVILREHLPELEAAIPDLPWCAMARAVEDEVHRQKGLYPNVDFYCAPTLYSLGFPMELFTPIFACSRSAGWAAHILEQYDDNRLIRPTAIYNGAPERPYVPIERRA